MVPLEALVGQLLVLVMTLQVTVLPLNVGHTRFQVVSVLQAFLTSTGYSRMPSSVSQATV
jgi:hypothetical protein